MLKNILSIGSVLNRSNQQSINGGFIEYEKECYSHEDCPNGPCNIQDNVCLDTVLQ